MLIRFHIVVTQNLACTIVGIGEAIPTTKTLHENIMIFSEVATSAEKIKSPMVKAPLGSVVCNMWTTLSLLSPITSA